MRGRILSVLVVLSIVLSLVIPLLLPSPVHADAYFFVSDHDTYIRSGTQADNNFGTAEELKVGLATCYPSGCGGEFARALLDFIITPLPDDATIDSAYLWLWYDAYNGEDPAGREIIVQRCLREGLDAWSELSADWYDRSGTTDWGDEGASGLNSDYTTAGQASAIIPSYTGSWMTWDVTTQVEWAFDNDARPNFLVTCAECEDMVGCYGTDCYGVEFLAKNSPDSTYWPILIVNYNTCELPAVATRSATDIEWDSATLNGDIIATGSDTVTRRGIQYGLTETATWDLYETGTFSTGDFSFDAAELDAETTYYFRAYATSACGTSYGAWKSFTTDVWTGVPIVETKGLYVYGIGCIYAAMTGDIIDEGTSGVFKRGFEHGDPESPTTTQELGSFDTGEYTLTTLVSDPEDFCYRAFAENSQGKGYGMWVCTYDDLTPPATNCTLPEIPGGATAIYDVNDLQDMNNDLAADYYLANDIDAYETATWNGGDGFEPIGGNFIGSLYGQGYTIIGLYIDRSWSGSASSRYVGLFNGLSTGAEIYNVNIVDAYIEIYHQGSDAIYTSAGILTASMTGDAYVEYVFTSGDVVMTSDIDKPSGSRAQTHGGGVTGIMGGYAELDKCASIANVSVDTLDDAWAWAGGLVGRTYSGGYASDCYARGTVWTSYVYAAICTSGGLVGGRSDAGAPYGAFDNCYATGAVTGELTTGGLVGIKDGSIPDNSTTDCFWDKDTTGQATSAGDATGLTTAQAKTGSTYTAAGWDFVDVWTIDEVDELFNAGYPYLYCMYSYGGEEEPPEEATLFSLTTTSGDGGSVTTPGEGTYEYAPDTVVNIVATPSGSYQFTAWTGDVGTIADPSTASTTITMTGNYTIQANFIYVEGFDLTIYASDGGTVTQPGVGTFAYPIGEVVSLRASAYEGYWFAEWTGDTTYIADTLDSTTTIEMLGDFTITAIFVEDENGDPPPEECGDAPEVETLAATEVTSSSAMLQGSVTDMGEQAVVYTFFQYGEDTTYGTNTLEQSRVSTGGYSRAAWSLDPSTTYWFRTVGRYTCDDDNYYVYGDALNFTTLADTGDGDGDPDGFEYQDCGETNKYDAYETGDNSTATVYGANWFSTTFTPEEAFRLDTIRLKMFSVGSPSTVTVAIRDVNDEGKPTGIDLTSAAYELLGPSVGWYEVDMPDYRLANQEYALVVRAVAGDASNYVGWQYGFTGEYTGGTYASSSNSGVSWTTDSDADFMFAMYGESVLCVYDVKVFSGYLEDDDWLFAIYYHNEFPPYYGTAAARDYFDLQLRVGNTTVASVGVPLWGDMPGSIYLSAAQAASLEWGSSYTVRMRGSFDPYPMDTYTLLPEDWRGLDLTLLDAWVYETVNSMSAYYEETLTTYLDNELLLNDAGSALFATGIPMLAAIRGHIFLNPELYVPYTEEDWARIYEEAFEWEELLGAKVSEDASTLGPIFGVTSTQFLQAAFFGTWAIAAIGAATFAGIGVIIASMPFLIGGIVAGILPITPFAIVSALMAIVLVWYFWWRHT